MKKIFLILVLAFVIFAKGYAQHINTTDNVIIIDFQTTSDPDKQVHGIFNRTSTVSYERDESVFLRLDGILNTSEYFNIYITELITHFHSDHISLSVLDRMIKNLSFRRLLAPIPDLDVSRNRTFDYLWSAGENENYRHRQTNRIQELTTINEWDFAEIITSSIGDFDYAAFMYDDDIEIEMFKYRKAVDANTDGIIYRITHKKVSYLLFGDFDDPAGIENLLDASLANEERQIEIYREIDAIKAQISETDNLYILNELLNRQLMLYEELSITPVIQADIIKWTHHAHRYEERYRSIIIKLNEVVDPLFIIYQPHHTQSIERFKEFIDSFDFKEKFINSAENQIIIISFPEGISTWIAS